MLPAFARGFLEGIVGVVGDFLGPPQCAACGGESGHRAVFCVPCAQAVERNPTPHFDLHGERIFAPYLYGGPLAQALQRFKYRNAPHLGRPLGDLLAGSLRSVFAASAAARLSIVPVPLHPHRLVQRGYNSPALICARVAAALRAPLATDILQRVVNTAPQAGKARGERLRDVQGAFAAVPGSVRAAEVLLVDDVATTGATLHACAAALREAGARAVHAVALCRAENFPPGPKDGV